MNIYRKAIFIPTLGAPKIIIIAADMSELNEYIGCDSCSARSINYADDLGYALVLFNDEKSQEKNLVLNPLASRILGQNGGISGNCVLVDINKGLVIEDLKKIVAMTS